MGQGLHVLPGILGRLRDAPARRAAGARLLRDRQHNALVERTRRKGFDPSLTLTVNFVPENWAVTLSLDTAGFGPDSYSSTCALISARRHAHSDFFVMREPFNIMNGS